MGEEENGTVSSLCSRGTPFIEQREILAIFGVMPLCGVFEGKKRHSLWSRIRQKSSVEVLCCRTPLAGAESSAHCCGFFSVTSDKDLSSPAGRACGFWTHVRRVKWDVHSCYSEEKKNTDRGGVVEIDRQQNTTLAFDYLIFRKSGILEPLTEKLCPRPSFPVVVSKQPYWGCVRIWQPWFE